LTLPEYIDDEDEGRAEVGLSTLRRILVQTKPHRLWMLGFLVAIAEVSILDSVYTYLRKQIVDQAILGSNPGFLRQAMTLYGATVLAQALGAFAFILLCGILGQRLQYDLRRAMFEHLQELSFSYFNRTPVGWVMARVNSDSERVAQLVSWGLLDATWGIFNIGTSAVFMLIINWRLALIVLGALPVLLIIATQFQRKILQEYRRVRRFNSRIVGAYNESITGVRVVKALCREERNLREFQRFTGDMYAASYRAAWLSALFLPVVQLVTALALGTILLYTGARPQWGGMTVGAIQAFVSYLTFIMWPIQDLARVYAELQHALASAERIFALLDTAPSIQDRAEAFDPGSLKGDIVFDHVWFDYEPETPVLADFNLQVRDGDTIALVGPTGGGKSTIVNLLCRFYEPRQGTIRIAGNDYTSFTLHAIQSRIGVVLQTPHLFAGTVAENIRYGRLDASDQDIIEAATTVGAHDFILKLAMGYDTGVGEGGKLLSVGQKQLVALARAILSRPDLFIMDEATSSVDTLTEALIQRGIGELMRDRTSFVIAHRLSTIKRASRILFIDDGQIAEMGSHAELLQARGRYHHLYVQEFWHESARAQSLPGEPLAASGGAS